MNEGKGAHRLNRESPEVEGKWGWVERVYQKFREAERISRHGQ